MNEGLPAERIASISQQGYEAILNWRIAGGEIADPSPDFLDAMRKAAQAARPEFAKAVGGEDVLKQAETSLGRNN